jgi:octaprenyl-diphosphate synthase
MKHTQFCLLPSVSTNKTLNIMKLPINTDITNGIPCSGVPSFRLIEAQLNRVRELINKQLTVSANGFDKLTTRTDDISRLLEYMNARSGKMLRPGLVLLTGSAVSRVTNEHIRVAAIVEMIHNATLLHDDVIDEGQKRRGLPTVNKLWGNESAVILGDFLLSRVFKICSDLEPKVINLIATAAARTCEGELRQVIQRHNWQWRKPCCALSESKYINIITEKSAAFFSSCCGVGALLAQASKKQAQSLERFGLNAGIAFQITDDLLDLTGDESQTGKTPGRDVNKNKLTLAVIHLLRVTGNKERKKVYEALNQTDEKGKDKLLKMLRQHGSLEYAHSRAQKFLDKALSALTGLKESYAKEALIETAKFMVNRES